MSKHQHEEEDINIGEVYSKTEKFLEEKKQPITFGLAAIVILIAASVYYFNMYLPPLEKEAQNQIFGAQKAFEVDSFELAMYGSDSYMGFEEIIDEYGSTKIGNTALYYMGVSKLQVGEYEEAIDYLESYSPEDHLTRSLRVGAIGDAQSQLGDYEDALSSYLKAADAYVNEFTTPLYLKKAGLVAESLEDFEVAVKCYKRIKNDYPQSDESRDIVKYLSRAESFVE